MDIMDSQLYNSDRVTLAMMLENGSQIHSQVATLGSMLMVTLGVNRLK